MRGGSPEPSVSRDGSGEPSHFPFYLPFRAAV
jgi:hypothetical protein